MTFTSFNPRRGEASANRFHEADISAVDRAAVLAAQAAPELARKSGEEISGLLLAIKDEITALGDLLVEKADEETALGIERLRGERDRTTNQLKLFADLVSEGSWVDATIDTVLPDRKPLPRPDLRRMLMPLGPVAVFGASNFPLAFSVAGGDTASALAAQNPVVVKAHPAHPETSELVAEAIAEAVRKQAFPPGTFAMLHGLSPEPSLALVQHPAIKAVAFTGSQRAGRALFDAGAKRKEPIPVFSEMGSTNPVFVLPQAIVAGADKIAEDLFRSVTLGVGQFCTCPGLVFAIGGDPFDRFVSQLANFFRNGKPGTMLNSSIARGFEESFARASRVTGVEAHRSNVSADAGKTEGQPGLLLVASEDWIRSRELHEEIFGPATVAVRCRDAQDLLSCAAQVEGSLTATVHGEAGELAAHRDLVELLYRKAGRLIFNGYPTGVEVGFAMQHGGPYPATTDARFTSVGVAAIYRFARPVCFQNFPDEALPIELQNANPRGIWRTVNGQRTREAL